MRNCSFQCVYKRLDRHYGPQEWWPAETPFEVMVGAVLTQNTAWNNVEKAIDALRNAELLRPESIHAADAGMLAELIRPAGYFNVKAVRLKALVGWLMEQGGIEVLASMPIKDLRHELLSVHGIGPETADDILLYAFGHPVFVIDAYTRRMFSRLGLIDEKADYELLRRQFETDLGKEAAVYNQYHALIVVQAKEVCRKKPHCDKCCLADVCRYPIND